ncbi:42100_t:CDS:2 [Gigaspora margarita]|uniref:42100_t:CDS:1 n=1 Tax=Gigaspora margarita TaxID=4874 RepID=A0ABN7V1M1_GIGMA|nr:42100_t:CDS:2 [Gigaspora margarita]
MSITRSGQIFKILSGRNPAIQQEEFEHFSDSQQSESVSFVTARSSLDPPPIYRKLFNKIFIEHQIFLQFQQKIQQEDGLEFTYKYLLSMKKGLEI